MPRWRTLWVLGRVSNLPTVWSNCLAGWWLGGGDHYGALPLLFLGATFLYLGGMYLNDAFDVEFDRRHRVERPIPSGAIAVEAVWRFGLTWLFAGALCLIASGKTTGVIGLVLLACILLYDAFHKLIAWSPILMGACRFLIYLAAASIAVDGVTGRAVWCGLALAAYVAGLSFLARRESVRAPINGWPMILVAAPVVLALIMNADGYRLSALALSVLLLLWVLLSVRPALRVANGDPGRAVAGLLAGIVLVDLLAVADLLAQGGTSWKLSPVFLGLFAAARLCQRFVPAT